MAFVIGDHLPRVEFRRPAQGSPGSCKAPRPVPYFTIYTQPFGIALRGDRGTVALIRPGRERFLAGFACGGPGVRCPMMAASLTLEIVLFERGHGDTSWG